MKRIYLDFNATTPVDPRVLEKMLPFFSEEFGNASSQHPHGWIAQKAVEQARFQVRTLLNAPHNKDIIFTSGATESNNLAILGLAQNFIFNRQKAHFITSKAEHHSVLEAMHHAEKYGIEVSYLPVNKMGQVEIENLEAALLPHTKLISLMWANNEVGSLNPITKIAKLAESKGILLHTDATQACGKVKIDLSGLKVDLLSLSAHKIYGPKGVGTLYISKDLREANSLLPTSFGGGQEVDLRSGTLNTTGIVGLGMACEIANLEMDIEAARLQQLSDQIWTELKEQYPRLEWNGHPTERIPGQMNLLFRGKRMDQILPRMINLSMSSGSACSSKLHSVSHVLQAIGLTREEILASIRLSVGRTTTPLEVKEACRIIKEHL